MTEVVIVGSARTAIGDFEGALASLKATELGSLVIKAALERAGVKADDVSEVFMGNVLTAGVGQAPARQAALGAGIPESCPCTTINKVCGSGMKTLMLAAQAILLGDADLVVAGGMESMSQAPYLAQGARQGIHLGNQTLLDSLIHDGLWDPYSDQHMGNCAELCARENEISREEQDKYAIESYQYALKAQEDGLFSDEIVPVTISGRKGKVTLVDTDESPSKVSFEKIPNLRPVFEKGGTITAANASSINDGAAAMVLCSRKKAEELGLKPIAVLKAYAQHAQKPEWFTTAPSEAMEKAISRASWNIDDVDLFEINEAFAVVPIMAQRRLGIPRDKVNVWGGAISLGHPIGASGTRIVVTLLSALKKHNKKRGVASLCIGGGEATAICVELL